MAWDSYYSPKHFETVLKRAAATNISPGKTLFLMVWFKGCITDREDPSARGRLSPRLKFRRDRRPGLPIEPMWLFYPHYCRGDPAQAVSVVLVLSAHARDLHRIKRDPERRNYIDLALSPVEDDETESRELFQSDAAQAYVRQEQRLDKVSHGAAA